MFVPMKNEERPQDEMLDGYGMKFETLEHGGAVPDTMPQAIRMTDPQGRSAVYVPLQENGVIGTYMAESH